MNAPLPDSGFPMPATAAAMNKRASTGKTLLLVGSIPGGRNVGQLLLREMLACVDPDDYVIAALLDQASDEARGADQACATRVFLRPREHATRRFQGRLGGLASAVERVRVYEPAISSVADQVAVFAEANDVRRVWAILNMTAVIDVCGPLAERLRVPVIAHVWDDVDHLTQQRGLDLFTRRRTARRFARILAKADRTAVIGEAMGEHYTKRFGARCQIIRHGVSDATMPRDAPTSADEFVIGFSGGMYCQSAWKAFQAALAKLNWHVAGKRIRFVVMSGHVSFSSQSPAHVEYLGWRADDEVHARLSECDLLYLPQPFEPSQRALAELSFPTKLSAYVATGRPVMIHGPDHASLVRFAREHPVGLVCTSLAPESIAQLIEAFAVDTAAYRNAAHAAASIANTDLSRSSFVGQVRSFLREESPEAAKS